MIRLHLFTTVPTIGDNVSIGHFAMLERVLVLEKYFDRIIATLAKMASIGSDCGCIQILIAFLCEVGNGVHLNSGIGNWIELRHGQVGSVHEKIPHLGKVVIEDDEVSNFQNRARLEARIGEGTKIDNLVQIGHNVKIGVLDCCSGRDSWKCRV